MKLSIFLLTAAVYAEEVAVKAAVPVPCPVCNCKPEIDKCVAKCENTLRSRDAQAAGTCQDSLTAAKAEHRKQYAAAEEEIQGLTNKLKEARSRIASLESNSTSELSTLRSSLVEQKNKYESQIKEERSLREKAVAESKAAATKIAAQLSKADAESSTLRAENDDLVRQVATLRNKIYNFEGVLFSRAHVEVLAGNLKTIGKAALLNSKDNIIRLFSGVDIFELMRLQSFVVYSKIEPQVKQAEAVWAAFADRVELNRRLNELRTNAVPYLRAGRNLVEQRMNRVVESLSRTNPRIRQMFPETFADRLVAFTYLGIVSLIVWNVVAAVFSVVMYPFQALRPSRRTVLPDHGKKGAVKTPNFTTSRVSKNSVRNSAAETDDTLRANMASRGWDVTETDETTTPREARAY